MYKDINMITNKGLGFKLTNSISFGESMISTRFIQKTIKADLYVRVNYVIPPRNLCGKVLEDSRGHHTEAGGRTLPCGAGRPHLQGAWPLGATYQPIIPTSVSHRLLGCISAVP
jgi:hypothetical protein